MLDHHDGIGPGRDHAAGEDSCGLPGFHVHLGACPHLHGADDGEQRRRGIRGAKRGRGADRVTIHGRTPEAGEIGGGNEVHDQDAAVGGGEGNAFGSDRSKHAGVGQRLFEIDDFEELLHRVRM